MEPHAYHFVTHWRVPGSCGEVADVLGDPLSLARWWPSVYLEVDELSPEGRDGLGRKVRLITKGWLPYTLRWELTVTARDYPHKMAIEAHGDLAGRGVWTFTQDGPFVEVVYDWRIRAEKPLLRRLSFLLRRIFEANHRWAMAQGERSLLLELARRRAVSDADRAAVPAPDGPVTYVPAVLTAAAALGAAGAAYLLVTSVAGGRRRRQRREHEGASGPFVRFRRTRSRLDR